MRRPLCLLARDDGLSAVESALLAAFIAVAAIGAIRTLAPYVTRLLGG